MKNHAVHIDHISRKALKYMYYTGINSLMISLFELVCLASFLKGQYCERRDVLY
jgi:hypothetical protein